MLRAALIVLSCLLQSCSFVSRSERIGPEAATTARAIDAAWNRHFDAARQHDAEAACEIYADDVYYEVAGQPPLRGKAAVKTMEAASMASTEVGDLSHLGVAVRTDGDVAQEIGTVQGDVGARGAEKEFVVFDYVAAWRRGADGAWRITHLIGHMVPAAKRR